MNERFPHKNARARAKKSRAGGFADMLMELEQRIAFDAAGAATADAAAQRDHEPSHASASSPEYDFAALAHALGSQPVGEPAQHEPAQVEPAQVDLVPRPCPG